MENILPLGSVILLKGDRHQLMITSRFPVTEKNGEIGYFEYGACLYPEGQMNTSSFFFNSEDIQKIITTGYSNEDEERMVEMYKEKLPEIKYPRFNLSDMKINEEG